MPTNLKISDSSLILNVELTKSVKKKYGIFFTSELLVNKILDKLKIILIKFNIKISKVLEPSCGSGEFLFGLNKYFSKLNILGLELNNAIYTKIRNFSFLSNHLVIKKADFLNFYDNKGFNLIIGNPPFELI